MPQSLLALLAIFGLSFLALQGARDRVSDLQETHRSDAVVQARGVGVEVLERLSGVAFDGGEGGTADGTGTEVYSPKASFGSSVDAAGLPLGTVFGTSGLDDLDDFDGAEGAIARVTVFDPVSASAQSIELEVDIAVDYVALVGSGWVVSPSARTHVKRASVTIRHPSFPSPVRLGRLFVAP